MIVSFETKSTEMPHDVMDDTAQSETALVLEAFLPYRLAVLAHATSRALSGVYTREFGLSIPEWRILANLGRFGPLNAGELAERSSMDKPKVTRALQRLEARGLTERSVVASDRRQVRLMLTRRGRLLFRQIAALALEWEQGLLAPLAPAERKALDRILAKLARRAEDMQAGAASAVRGPRVVRDAEAP
jgi:DNA-binding MarR family transcriptional regulator